MKGMMHFARLCAGIIEADIRLPHLQHVGPEEIISKAGTIHEFATAYHRKEEVPTYVPQRFCELDSLRGVAACTVVLGHFGSALGVGDLLTIWDLLRGHDAVILFFVLSGFVLSLPYERSGRVSYWKFIVKRICRIYLPYLGALILAVAMNYHYHGLVTNNKWINQTWKQEPDVRVIGQHILFVGYYQWTTFNTAFWSLVYEMRISLIFPVLAIAVFRFRNEWMLVFAIFTSLLSAHYYRIFLLLHLNPDGFRFADTVYYMSFFILGAILAKNREFVQTQYRKLPRFSLWASSAFFIVFYYHPFNIPMFTAPVLPPGKIRDWSVAFGSLIVIAMALSSGPFKSFLNHGAINYLGRISYSLYLVHGTVLFVLIYICRGRLPLSCLPIYLITVLGLASIFYYLIEMPSMVLGQKLGKMLR
jgi:peptidoglycan/LPS O-acetylase OafA/YrhL